MKTAHFEALRPVCPVCRRGDPVGFRLEIAHVSRTVDGEIIEGVLHCTRPECRREYPIIDGVPLIITSLRSYVSEQLLHIHGRDDLSETIESIIGDCCGSGSVFDTMRQHLSSYVWDHYGDLDPDESGKLGEDDDIEVGEAPRPGAVTRTLNEALSLVNDLEESVPAGPILDIGCSVGRGALTLAEATGEMVLGIDLYYPALRVAQRVLREGQVSYPRRRVGMVYDRRSFAVDLPGRDQVDVWACDVTALPFPAGTFSTAVGLNLLDSVRSPVDLLTSIAVGLAPGGLAYLSSPYDWSPDVTPVEAWIGGHSQRTADRGASESILRQLLTPGALPSSIHGFEILAEMDGVPWQVRMHDRSNVTYRAHLLIARVTAS